MNGPVDYQLEDEICFVSHGRAWSGEIYGVSRNPFFKTILHVDEQFSQYDKKYHYKISPIIERGCSHCGQYPNPARGVSLHMCSGCSNSMFCSKACQTAAWPIHKKICRPPNESDQKIDVLWALTGMHFIYKEYALASMAAAKILGLSKTSTRWCRDGQQKRLAYMLKSYAPTADVPPPTKMRWPPRVFS